jgi:3-oxoacyl-[acyl-carrier protein] reductase
VAKPFLECRWTDFEPYLDVYLRATTQLVQLAAPAMQARRFGRVINVLSSHAFGAPPPRLAPYVAAKSALAGLSRSLAVELGPFGITVNMIAPSVVITEQTGAMSDRARQLAASQVPVRRLAAVDDVAAAASFLASDRAGFVNGAILPLTGGGVLW